MPPCWVWPTFYEEWHLLLGCLSMQTPSLLPLATHYKEYPQALQALPCWVQVSYAISAMQVMTVDIQTGDRHVRETAPAPDLAPGTPPRAQGAIPLKRSLQKRLAARKAMDVIAEGAALGTPAGSERPYFKVGIAACVHDCSGYCMCSPYPLEQMSGLVILLKGIWRAEQPSCRLQARLSAVADP